MDHIIKGIIQNLSMFGDSYIPEFFTDKDMEQLDQIIKKEFGCEYSTIDKEELIANDPNERIDDPTEDFKCRLYLLDC